MPPSKRRKKSSAIVEDDFDTAEAVTHETITTTTKSGLTKTKTVLVPLVPIREQGATEEGHTHGNEPTDFGEHYFDGVQEASFPSRQGKKQRDYVQQFVDRVQDLLQANLSRESWPIARQRCRQCQFSNFAVWRCIDCTLAHPVCRQCMRQSHSVSPFHRIECWTGAYFRRAALWEVGSYILVEHHYGEPICDGLKFQIEMLERLQAKKDIEEQQIISARENPTTSASASARSSGVKRPASATEHEEEMEWTTANDDNEHVDWPQEIREDAEFFDSLYGSRDHENPAGDRDEADADGGDDESGEQAEADVWGFEPYLDIPKTTGEIEGEADSTFHIHGDHEAEHQSEQQMAEPERPRADGLNNTYVRVVHTNGIHHLAMVTCYCRGADNVPLDLVACRLVPASFTRIRTLFTAEVMDYFRLCNLELKASAYQFYQLVRRMTRTIGHAEVVNVYHEFRRMSRLWRWMKKLKWAGYGHDKQNPLRPAAGSLANFCPTCPQPGVNLPDDWKADHNRFVYKVVLVADGNFKADHVRQKSDEDVWLLDGAGMSPNRDEYYRFLATAIERYTKAPCQNTFQAIMNALLASKACDLTGIVAIACARHGCFVPNALVDLFKGEQQKNVDFAFLKALMTIGIDPDQGVLLMYDIVCQYIIHLWDRIGHLLPVGLTIDRAIDLFHVHAHNDECFFRYATTFIPGAAVVAGQILESLWSNLNSISPTARTATLPHRAEILDDHACDSNHKKLLGMTETLQTRYKDATAMAEQADAYYLELSQSVDMGTIHTWEKEIREAEDNRLTDIKVMDIYAARLGDRLVADPTPSSASATDSTAPPASDSQNSLTEEWIEYAILVEDTQIQVQDMVRRLGPYADEHDRNVVEQKRQVLVSMLVRLTTLQDNAGIVSATSGSEPLAEDEAEFDDVSDSAAASSPDEVGNHTEQAADIKAERQTLTIPSNGNVATDVGQVELKYRTRQARRQVSRLRDIIADISFQYSHVIRGAIRRSVRSNAQKRLKTLHHDLVLQARIYSRCRSRLIALKCDQRLLSVFRILTKEDLKASTSILRPNIAGSSSLQLSWLWQTGRWFLFAEPETIATTNQYAEAEPQSLLEFKRVHWLRGRAQKQRWHEEVLLVTYEMQWTVRYFVQKGNKWNRDVERSDVAPGARAYGRRQGGWWIKLAYVADKNMPGRTISVFTVFSSQHPSRTEEHQRTQQIVWYAESRFREALLYISKAEKRHQQWMQKYLREELKMIIISIGISTAIGQALDLPIFVRSLADSLICCDDKDLPLEFHDDILAALDAGIPAEHPASHVDQYVCNWWNAEADPGPDCFLSLDNIDIALQDYKKRSNGSPIVRPPLFPTIFPSDHRIVTECPRCREYRDLASDAICELQKVGEFVNAAESSSMMQWRTHMRRAQGLYTLHEEVVRKEMQDITASAPASAHSIPAASASDDMPSSPGRQMRAQSSLKNVVINRKSRYLSIQAQAELARLRQLPTGSYKWTWGAELTEEDIGRLVQSDSSPGPPHSGYDTDLPDGNLRGQESPMPSLPISAPIAPFSDVGSDIVDIPPRSDTLTWVDGIAFANAEQPMMRRITSETQEVEIAEPEADAVLRQPAATAAADDAEMLWEEHGMDQVVPSHQSPPHIEAATVAVDLAAQAWSDDSRTEAEPGRDDEAEAFAAVNEALDAWHHNDSDERFLERAPDGWGDLTSAESAPSNISFPSNEFNAPSTGADLAADAWQTEADDDVQADTVGLAHAPSTGADLAADAWQTESEADTNGMPHAPSTGADLAADAWQTEADDDVEADTVGLAHAPSTGADLAADAWQTESEANTNGLPHAPSTGADLAADAWQTESEADTDGLPQFTADEAEYAWDTNDDAPLERQQTNADTAADVWASLTASNSESDHISDAEGSANDSDADADNEAEASLPSSPRQTHHSLDMPVTSVTPSRITLPRVYTAADFDFLDATWLEEEPEAEGETDDEMEASDAIGDQYDDLE